MILEIKLVVAVALASFFITGCSKDVSSITGPSVTQSLVGTVTSGGLPLNGVDVSIPALAKFSKTGTDGRYEITNLTPGPYRVVFYKFGYADAEKMITVPAEVSAAGADMARALKVLQAFVMYRDANPAPLPNGRPMALCGLPFPEAGEIKADLSSSPGGTTVQVFLQKKSDFYSMGCGPDMDACPGAIEPVSFTNSATKVWRVMPGEYCVVLRNRSTTLQILNGPLIMSY